MKKIIITICCILTLIILPIYSNNKDAVYAEVEVQCKSALLIDYNSGELIFDSNCDAKVQVASIVKLMTTLLTFEELEKGTFNLDTKLTSSENAAGMGGSQVFIDPYCEYTIRDMLRSVIIASANDASVALAEYIAGSEEKFVEKMNKKALELGMKNTHYANATGLPAVEEYSSARDTAILLKEVMKHKEFYNYTVIWMDELTHPSGRKTELVNTNKLIRYYKGCDCGKTGFTDEAGYCLTASAEKNNMRFIAVALGCKDSQSRFNEVAKLLNYGFANFENKEIITDLEPIAQIKVNGSKITETNLYACKKYVALTKKGEEVEYATKVEIPDFIKAPLQNGEQVGTIKVIKDGNVISEIGIIVKNDIAKLTYKDSFEKIIDNWGL